MGADLSLGVIDFVRMPNIGGWVRGNPGEVIVELCQGEEVLARAPANMVRSDLPGGRAGFVLVAPPDIRLWQLGCGEVRIFGCSQALRGELGLWEPIAVAAQLEGFEQQDVSRVLDIVSPSALLRLRKYFYDRYPPVDSVSALCPAGTISDDESAIVGRNGFIFLYRGTNDVMSLYKSPPSSALSRRWAEIVDARNALCDSLDIQFVQVLIPEKSSLLPDLYPYKISGPSATYVDITAGMARKSVLDCAKAYLNDLCPMNIFQRHDSHLSSYGAAVTTTLIAEALSHPISIRKRNSRYSCLKGDLSSKYPQLTSREYELSEIYEEVDVCGLALKEPVIAEECLVSGHVGTRIVWRCPDAPIQKKVVCFGNSFFERGGASTTLSWWFARVFTEFHFIWHPDMNFEYLKSVRPDAVICQTIERFMRRLPTQ